MTVLQICVSMGVEACAKGVPILAEELERDSAKPKSKRMICGIRHQTCSTTITPNVSSPRSDFSIIRESPFFRLQTALGLTRGRRAGVGRRASSTRC